jgi:hypothetical protein
MGGKFDKSFNEAANAGIQKWSKETGKKFLEFEISNESQREQAIRRMAEKGASPIIGIGFAQAVGFIKSGFIESIKREIYKWGPVVGSFTVFPDFLEYDGLTIYEGPKDVPKDGSKDDSKDDSKDGPKEGLGGHAVKILGWGKENGIDFWWIANSWSTSWGLSGYFRMKMNIEICQLENNVVGFIPDLVGFSKDYLLYETINKKDSYLREWFNVDNKTGYRIESIIKIKNGILKGNLDDLICEYTPDFSNMWVGEMTQEDVIANYLRISQWQEDTGGSYVWYIFLVFFMLCISYLIGRNIGKRTS